MSNETDKKAEFIVTWYRKERIKFNFVKQIVLAKTWIDICTKNDEYEMAAALQKEKERIIRNYLRNKRKNRSLREKIRFYLIKIRRKFIR